MSDPAPHADDGVASRTPQDEAGLTAAATVTENAEDVAGRKGDTSAGAETATTADSQPAGDGAEKAPTSDEQQDKASPAPSKTQAATASSTASPTLAPMSAATKKFNSLSVSKQFLQKSSPTLSNASAAGIANSSAMAKQGSGGASTLSLHPPTSSRLSTVMPTSRLSTAKLANASSKPVSQGWAQVTPPPTQSLQPSLASISSHQSVDTSKEQKPVQKPSATHTSANVSAGGNVSNVNTPSATAAAAATPAAPVNNVAKSVITASANPASASPKLVTALARSTSPHIKMGEGSKGSPGLRNAALSGASAGRAASPAVAHGSSLSSASSAATRAPWATIKKGNVEGIAKSIGKPSDFPTAAEAAQAKLEAEQREKAAAAEAAAKAEHALQDLDRFRGASLGQGNHWDEMDDDDLDEVMDFGGIQDSTNDKAVTKEERFRDVGHDRSWPPRGDSRSTSGAARRTPAGASVGGGAGGETTANGEGAPHQRSLYNARAKAETVAVRSGEGISLDPAPLSGASNGGYGRERRGSFLGGYGGGGAGGGTRRGDGGATSHRHHQDTYSNASAPHQHQHHQQPHQQAAPQAAPVRAWGPLAQRQASLNPDAPKAVQPVTASPAAPEKPPVERTSERQAEAAPAASSQPLPPTKVMQRKPPTSTSDAHSTAPTNEASSRPSAAMNGRALPPHLAALSQQASSQESGVAGRQTLRNERADWESARPTPAVDDSHSAEEGTAAARPYGKLVASARQPQQPAYNPPASRNDVKGRQTEGQSGGDLAAVSSGEPPKSTVDASQAQRDHLLSAAERSRQRHLAEEEERQKERERAHAKAAAIEKKMREAEEAKKNEERLRREQQAAAAEKDDDKRQRLDAKSAKLPNAPSLHSPSDEAISWRRGPAVASKAGNNNGPARQDADLNNERDRLAPGNARNSGRDPATRILLRRSTETPASQNESHLATEKVNGMPNEQRAPVRKERAQGQRRTKDGTESTASVLPRAEGSNVAVAQPPPTRPNRVEIIAPTDEGAVKHMQQQRQKEREARMLKNRDASQKSPPLVSALKVPVSSAPAAQTQPPAKRLPSHIPKAPEPQTTRMEVPFDPAPVWNKFKVRVGTRGSRAPQQQSHQQKARRGHNDRVLAARLARMSLSDDVPAVRILSWEPPIHNLSSRTLSRDDQFFAKKYLKGIVISKVTLPKRTMRHLADERRELRKQGADRTRAANSVAYRKDGESQQPSLSSQLQTQTFADSEVSASQHTARAALSSPPSVKVPGVKSAHDRAPRAPASLSAAPSSSGVDIRSRYGDGLEPSRTATTTASVPTSRSTSSTWGENSLTFAGLDPSPEGAAAESERNRIKDVWSSPSDASRSQQRPTQNSLKGIVDDFPSTISLMTALDEGSGTASGVGYQDASTNTMDAASGVNGGLANAATMSAPTSRMYSPLVNSESGHVGRTSDGSVGAGNGHDRTTVSAANSPIADASSRMGGRAGESRVQSQSPSSSVMRATDQTAGSGQPLFASNASSGHHPFVQQEHGGARAAFGPYAYPSTFSGLANTPTAQHAVPVNAQMAESAHHYSSSYGEYGGIGGVNNAGSYGVPAYASQQTQQARYGGNNRYRNAMGSNGGAFAASALHGNGYDTLGMGGANAAATNASGNVNAFLTNDRSAFAAAAGVSLDGLGSPAGLTNAGWPLVNQMGMNEYGTPPNNYYAAQPHAAYNAYEHVHQSSYPQRNAYGRMSSSNYRGGGYNSGSNGQPQQAQQQHGRRASRAGSNYGTTGSFGGGSMTGMEGYRPYQAQQQQYGLQQSYPLNQAGSGAAGGGSGGSSLQATAKPFYAEKADNEATSEQDDAQTSSQRHAVASATVDQTNANAHYGRFNAALW